LFVVEVIDVDPVDPVDAEPRPAGAQVWKVEDWFADDEGAAAADEDPIDPEARPSTPVTVDQLRYYLRRFEINDLAETVCKYCLEAKPFLEVIVPCGHCACSGCCNMMDNCPECRPAQRIVRTERLHAASMMLAWRSDRDLAGNFAAGVEANEEAVVDPMAGRRPADVTEEEYMERMNVEMAQELNEELNRANGNDNDGN
jgi:hypothetical protein